MSGNNKEIIFKNINKYNSSQLINRYGYRMTSDFIFGINKDGTQKRGREHHLIWIKANKKRIPKGYELHHKDGNKLDNNIKNLILLSKSMHRRLHYMIDAF